MFITPFNMRVNFLLLQSYKHSATPPNFFLFLFINMLIFRKCMIIIMRNVNSICSTVARNCHLNSAHRRTISCCWFQTVPSHTERSYCYEVTIDFMFLRILYVLNPCSFFCSWAWNQCSTPRNQCSTPRNTGSSPLNNFFIQSQIHFSL